MSNASKGSLGKVVVLARICTGWANCFEVKLEICSEDANKAVEEHDGREDHVRYECQSQPPAEATYLSELQYLTGISIFFN